MAGELHTSGPVAPSISVITVLGDADRTDAGIGTTCHPVPLAHTCEGHRVQTGRAVSLGGIHRRHMGGYKVRQHSTQSDRLDDNGGVPRPHHESAGMEINPTEESHPVILGGR